METYVIVQWPDVQSLMDFDWFQDECHLISDENGVEKYGSSAYFVPKSRIDSLKS